MVSFWAVRIGVINLRVARWEPEKDRPDHTNEHWIVCPEPTLVTVNVLDMNTGKIGTKSYARGFIAKNIVPQSMLCLLQVYRHLATFPRDEEP